MVEYDTRINIKDGSIGDATTAGIGSTLLATRTEEVDGSLGELGVLEDGLNADCTLCDNNEKVGYWC
jgi:hypothetical protein